MNLSQEVPDSVEKPEKFYPQVRLGLEAFNDCIQRESDRSASERVFKKLSAVGIYFSNQKTVVFSFMRNVLVVKCCFKSTGRTHFPMLVLWDS